MYIVWFKSVVLLLARAGAMASVPGMRMLGGRIAAAKSILAAASPETKADLSKAQASAVIAVPRSSASDKARVAAIAEDLDSLTKRILDIVFCDRDLAETLDALNSVIDPDTAAKQRTVQNAGLHKLLSVQY